jgi:S-adenosylmethionine hydrolase
VLSRAGVRHVIHATEPAYFRQSISRTFHGRDVFAPLAAWLSCGVTASDVGVPIEDYVRLELSRPRQLSENLLEGEVIYRDRFGNLITNISESYIAGLWGSSDWGRIRAQVETSVIDGLDSYYAQRAPDTPGLIINSWGLCEIFVNGGNAAQETGAVEGSPVKIQRLQASPRAVSEHD